MPEAEYRSRAREYIVQKYGKASQIRESLLAKRQKSQGIEFER